MQDANPNMVRLQGLLREIRSELETLAPDFPVPLFRELWVGLGWLESGVLKLERFDTVRFPNAHLFHISTPVDLETMQRVKATYDRIDKRNDHAKP